MFYFFAPDQVRLHIIQTVIVFGFIAPYFGLPSYRPPLWRMMAWVVFTITAAEQITVTANAWHDFMISIDFCGFFPTMASLDPELEVMRQKFVTMRQELDVKSETLARMYSDTKKDPSLIKDALLADFEERAKYLLRLDLELDQLMTVISGRQASYLLFWLATLVLAATIIGDITVMVFNGLRHIIRSC